MNYTRQPPLYLFNNSTDSLSGTSFVDTLASINDTESTSRTIPGPGAFSGKVVLALGKATLHGAEVIIIWRRFQVISSKFPHRDRDDIKGIERMYEDILELARSGLYSNAIRTRALRVILAQIGSGHIEKLVQCLITWHKFELQLFLSELMEAFDPLGLAKAPGIGSSSSLVQAYESSFVDASRHSLEPFVFFLRRLILASRHTTRVVFEAGVVKFLVHAYMSGFSDPLALGTRVMHKCSQLCAACNSLLDTSLNSSKGSALFLKDRLHVLWPMQPGSLPFQNGPGRPAQRAEIWRSTEAGVVDLRVQSISDMMLLEDHRSLLEQDFLDDIASDMLEFSRDSVYHDAITTRILEMCLILIGSHKTEELVYCISTWPTTNIQIFISKLINMFDPFRLNTVTMGGKFSNHIHAYYQSFTSAEVDHPLEPVVTFIDHLAQVGNHTSGAVLGGGTLDFFTHLYIVGFSDPLGDDMFRGSPALRVTCDSVLRTCSGTQTGLKFISNHQLYTLWPTLVLPTFPFINLPADRCIQRANIWKKMELEFMLSRMQSIYNMVAMGPLIELDSLDNIAVDVLEISRLVASSRTPDTVAGPYGDFTCWRSPKTRAIDVILLLVGDGRTEDLISHLMTWPLAEIQKTVSKLVQMSSPFREQRRTLASGKPPEGSIDTKSNYALKPLVIFLDRLVQNLNSQSASQVILEGGVLDFLLHLYLTNFHDPLDAIDLDHTRSNLRLVCDSLLCTLSKTGQGLILVGEHKICILWAMTPNFHFDDIAVNRPDKRAEFWRSTDSDYLSSQLAFVLDRIRARGGEECRALLDFHPFNNVASDMLDFLGYIHPYPNTIKQYALSIILVLIATGRTEGLITDLETWPQSRVALFLTELVEAFVFRAFRDLRERRATQLPSLVQMYYHSLIDPKAHPMKPLFTFCSKMIQKRPVTQDKPVMYWSTDLGFLLHLYLSNFRNSLSAKPVEMRNHSTLRVLCESLSSACLKSTIIKHKRRFDVSRPYDWRQRTFYIKRPAQPTW